jgi:hypothetical protein
MRIEEKVLDELRASSDENLKPLLEFYDFVTTDRTYESVVAMIITLNKFNEDLIENPVSILTSTSMLTVDSEGELDEKQEVKKDKEIDRVLKYLEKLPMLLAGLAKLQEMWTNEEIENLNKDKRIKASEDRAFKARK